MDVRTDLQKAYEEAMENVRGALEAVQIEMVNHAKANAPFKDRTGNLRNSIGYVPATVDAEGIHGAITAGMEYAPYVEFRPGYWVLGGTMLEFRGKLLDRLAAVDAVVSRWNG